jgi:ubiquinone/menaquinone biosynthesis C-methylase UbiE
MLHHIDTSQRFAGREDNYHKYRPDYPDEMIGFFYQNLGLNEHSVIADIGSGTGKLSQYFIARGNTTYGIEINENMRNKAEETFKEHSHFISVNGSAEKTTLPDNSVDLITAAQAFHWFKPELTQREFKRILKPDCFVALIWNIRQKNTPLQIAYNELLKKEFPEFSLTGHLDIKNMNIKEFFNNKEPREEQFDYQQNFDRKGLIGRALSSSYTDPNNTKFIESLHSIFDKYNKNGQVTFSYKTHVMYGQLSI